MEPEVSLPLLQDLANCPYPEPALYIQSIPPHSTSWRSILILFFHLRLGLPSGIFPSGVPTKILYTPFLFPTCATCPAHLILLDFITKTILSSSLCSSSPLFCYHVPLRPECSPQHTILSKTPSLRSSLNVSNQVSHAYKTNGKIIVLYIFIFKFLGCKLGNKRFCAEW